MKVIIEQELETEMLTGKEIRNRFDEFQYCEFIPVRDLKLGREYSKQIVDNIHYVIEHPNMKFHIIKSGDFIIKKMIR